MRIEAEMTSSVELTLPGDRLTVFLINQSESMKASLSEYGLSIAEAVADSLNLYLQKLYQVRTTSPGAFTGENFAVSIFGYGGAGDSVRSILQIDPTETRANAECTRHDESTISSDNVHPVFPFWLKHAAGGKAPLCSALFEAYETIASWSLMHHSAQPPQLINITDGSVTDGDPTIATQKLKSVSTDQGNAIFWNLQLSADGSPVMLFPCEDAMDAAPADLVSLWLSSSPLKSAGIRDVLLEFPEVSKLEGARCCILNADLSTLVRALACITRLPLP